MNRAQRRSLQKLLKSKTMSEEQKEHIKREAERIAFEEAMAVEHTLTFTKKELAVIFNLMIGATLKYGDFLHVQPIVQKIEPIVAVASNIPPKQNHKEDELIGVTKEKN